MNLTKADYRQFKRNINRHFKGAIKARDRSINPNMSRLTYYIGSALPFSDGASILKNEINTFYYKSSWVNNNYEGGEYKVELSRSFDIFHTVNEKECRGHHRNIKDYSDITEQDVKDDITKVIDTSIDFIMGLFKGSKIYSTKKPYVFRSEGRLLDVCVYKEEYEISHGVEIIIYTPTIVNERYKIQHTSPKKAPKLTDKEISRDVLVNLLKDKLNILYELYLTTDNPISEAVEESMKKRLI